ncbi:MAG: N-acetyl-gamma-glutamyl-phosphate reductase [Pseudomonadota bacterium]
MRRIDTVILGAGGYVGGELLRLLASHPHFHVAAAVSESRVGQPLSALLPPLQPSYPDAQFVSMEQSLQDIDDGSDVAIFAAAPHGVSASIIAKTLDVARARNLNAKIVDLSADFRHRSEDVFASIYDTTHAAPELLGDFECVLPEHAEETPSGHISHPGCFATAALLATVPLIASDSIEPDVFLSGVTGSTGSGRTASAGTHHPERHANLYAYKPLAHRHAPEIASLTAAHTGVTPRVHFVPHSGPFARGIHITLAARTQHAQSAEDILEVYRSFYAHSVFVDVVSGTPRLKDVVASNRALIGVAVEGGQLAAFCVIDNLIKGAAGGAVQWMNRLWGIPQEAGLTAPGISWT